jgi:hypothetical protein
MLTIEEITPVDRAEALFASAVPTGAPVTAADIDLTIAQTMLARGGAAGCAATMATAYGENPAHAAGRMRWALSVLRNERVGVTA